MRRLLELLLSVIMWLVSKIYTYQTNSFIHLLGLGIYTLWIRNFIGHVGYRSTIAYPCSLQGSGGMNIKIGDYTNIQSHCILGCWDSYSGQHYMPSITIGNNCSIGEYNHITACNKITIGDGLLTGRFVYIGDNAHGGLSVEEANIPPVERKLVSKGDVKIGDNVWIGDKATILGGVTIGNNVIIAANAVVTKDFENNCVIAGVPAEVIKYLK